jgi:hypothetical protein
MKKLLALAAVTLLAFAGLAAACDDDEDDFIVDPSVVPTYALKIEDAPIDALDILVLESFPPQYNLLITSGLPSGCAQFNKAEITGGSGNTITVRVTNTVPDDPNVACTAIYGTKETTLPLGSEFTSSETYTVNVNDKSIDFTAQ